MIGARYDRHELNIYTGRVPRDLPDAPKTNKAADHLRDLHQRLIEADRELAKADAARQAAVLADREAYATAIRNGKKDPGTPATQAADKAIADAMRRVEATHRATEQAIDDLQSALNEEHDAIRAAAQKQRADADQAAHDALDALDAALNAKNRAVVVEVFADKWPNAGKFHAGSRQVEALTLLNNESPSVDQVVESLRAALTATDKSMPNPDQPGVAVVGDATLVLPQAA
jgi:hypothetical protein